MKRTGLYSFISILLMAAGVLVLKAYNTAPSSLAPSNNIRAAVHYQNYCAGCHGERFERFTPKAWMEEEGIETAFTSIKNGIEDSCSRPLLPGAWVNRKSRNLLSTPLYRD
jgi:mono/diheme cytochrome c family protein